MMDITNLRQLNVHAANENDIGPRKGRWICALDILVDEPDLPALGQIGSDDQYTLRGHEGAYARYELKRVSKSAEGRSIGRKDAKDISGMRDGNRALQVDPLKPTPIRTTHVAAGWTPTRL